MSSSVPTYLKGYEKEYQVNPRTATLNWFVDAKHGPIAGIWLDGIATPRSGDEIHQPYIK